MMMKNYMMTIIMQAASKTKSDYKKVVLVGMTTATKPIRKDIKQRLKKRLESTEEILKEESEESEIDCVICFEGMKNRHQKFSCHQCNNTFHMLCISKWLRNKDTCPLCRNSC